jgi:hypothetical protein
MFFNTLQGGGFVMFYLAKKKLFTIKDDKIVFYLPEIIKFYLRV